MPPPTTSPDLPGRPPVDAPRAVDFIIAKRDGHAHPAAAIDRWVRLIIAGEVPDYQVSAWLMAVVWRGLDPVETLALTEAIADSGDRLDLAELGPWVVDKHSTGGVGDKTTLVVGPWAAALGLTVAKVSGRGLGHTGGTLDKLESVPGLRVDLSPEAFMRQARDVGVVIAGQTDRLAPADKVLYALRDVTGTVDNRSLIAASIMGKKLAAGAPAIVLDVKAGRGALLADLAQARALASAMLAIGRGAGRRMAACISDMDRPLGRAIGNALEVREAIGCLRGDGPEDLERLSRGLARLMVETAGRDEASGDLDERVDRALSGGEALERLRRLIRAQGGDDRVVDDPDRLPRAPHMAMVTAPRSGYVGDLSPKGLAHVALVLGAGRRRAGDAIDPSVGLVLRQELGDAVSAGQPLIEVHARDEAAATAACAAAAAALSIQDAPPIARAGPILETLRPATR